MNLPRVAILQPKRVHWDVENNSEDKESFRGLVTIELEPRESMHGLVDVSIETNVENGWTIGGKL